MYQPWKLSTSNKLIIPLPYTKYFFLLFRYINKQEEEHGEISPELISKIQDMVAKMDKMNFDEDSLFGDDFSGSDDSDED